jgi:hypothetical protein
MNKISSLPLSVNIDLHKTPFVRVFCYIKYIALVRVCRDNP